MVAMATHNHEQLVSPALCRPQIGRSGHPAETQTFQFVWSAAREAASEGGVFSLGAASAINLPLRFRYLTIMTCAFEYGSLATCEVSPGPQTAPSAVAGGVNIARQKGKR